MLNLPIFPGIDKVIARLAADYTLAIVSSTITAYINTVLSKHSLLEYFDAVLGNDVATSKVTKFRMIIKRYQLRPDRCVMITDTLGDLREAHAVNMHTIAVTWGFHDRHTLAKGNPAAIVESPAELPEAIAELFDKT